MHCFHYRQMSSAFFLFETLTYCSHIAVNNLRTSLWPTIIRQSLSSVLKLSINCLTHQTPTNQTSQAFIYKPNHTQPPLVLNNMALSNLGGKKLHLAQIKPNETLSRGCFSLMVMALESKMYGEQLRSLGLSSLEQRRMRGGLMAVTAPHRELRGQY